MDEYAKIIL